MTRLRLARIVLLFPVNLLVSSLYGLLVVAKLVDDGVWRRR